MLGIHSNLTVFLNSYISLLDLIRLLLFQLRNQQRFLFAQTGVRVNKEIPYYRL